jgi:hypothetical protein
MKRWIPLLLILFVTIARGEEQVIQSQSELLWALARAKSIRVTGCLGGDAGDKKFDLTVVDPGKIREIGWVFKNADLQPDLHWTAEFKAGTTLRTALQAKVTLDNKFVFDLLAGNLVILAAHETLRATRSDKEEGHSLANDLGTALFRE